jgi:hypothetical protein
VTDIGKVVPETIGINESLSRTLTPVRFINCKVAYTAVDLNPAPLFFATFLILVLKHHSYSCCCLPSSES